MSQERIINLDPVIHTPIRLAVLSVLVSVQRADFAYLKESVKATDGNLSTHLSKLENAGYIRISKTFEGKKPRTLCSITRKGRTRFIQYIDNMQKIVEQQKGNL